MSVTKVHRKEKWWFHFIRGINLFAFRYWWLILLLFLLGVFSFFWFCNDEQDSPCAQITEVRSSIDEAIRSLEDCCACNDVAHSLDYIDELRLDYGGSTGEVMVTLVWNTTDDLDLHVIEPSGERIYFSEPLSSQNGTLDIDKNRSSMDLTINPIENIFYPDLPHSGTYTINVHCYSKNSNSSEIPYTLAVNINGQTKLYNDIMYNKGDLHRQEFIIR